MAKLTENGPGKRAARLVLWAVLWIVATAGAAPAESRFPAITNGGVILVKGGDVLVAEEPDTPFVPASIAKLATALVALELLGPDYRFRTEFYLRAGHLLCIKGYGDPFLVSEDVEVIGSALKQLGLANIDGIVLDNSYFDLDGPAAGTGVSTNPYDAVNDALAVNFGSLALRKDAAGRVTSAEPQTPVIPLMREVGAGLAPGSHRVNVSAFPARNGLSNNGRYTAELFAARLHALGLGLADRFTSDRIRPGDTLVFTYRNPRTVAELIRDCLHFSNNFIANQLALGAAAERYGPPATWRTAQRAIIEALQHRLGLPMTGVVLAEGSGLSRTNKVTPRFMIEVLERFEPYADLLKRDHGLLLKSGTLTGVYSYAGYFSSDGRHDPFVIILNQKRNSRNTVLRQLRRLYDAVPERTAGGAKQ